MSAEQPQFRPLTIAEAAKATGRTSRTIQRWVSTGQLTRYEMKNPRQVVLAEKEVMEMERQQRAAANASRVAIAARAGSRKPQVD